MMKFNNFKSSKKTSLYVALLYYKQFILEYIFIYSFIAIFLLSLFCAYRYELFRLFTSFSGSNSGLANFMLQSFPSDFFTILSVSGILTLITLIRSRLTKTLIIGITLQFFIFFLATCLEFTRIYEVPFSIHSTGDLGSTWFELLYYCLHTVSSYILVRLLVVTLVLWSGLTAQYYFSFFKNNFYNREPVSNFQHKCSRLYKHMVFSIFCMALILTFTSKRSIAKAHNINKFLDNPLSSNFIDMFESDKDSLAGIQVKALEGPLPRTSFVSDKQFPEVLTKGQKKKYNVILYVFESTAARYLSLRQNNKQVTPNWNKLARHSFVAKQHYANFPLTLNSLFSIFSSAYSLPSNRWITVDYPDIAVDSMPKILKQQGYRTGLFHSGNLLYANLGTYFKHCSFDLICKEKNLKNSFYKKRINFAVDDRALIKPAVTFMKKNASRPFFVTMLPVAPHYPYEIPSEQFNMGGEQPKEISSKKKYWLNYLNALHYADATLGLLVKNLKKAKLLDNTILIVVADHGEAFYQHRGNFNHPHYLYEENVHIPFIIYNKELFPSSYYYEGLSSHVDILPTLLDILGVPFKTFHEGSSLFARHEERIIPLHTYWREDYQGIRDGKWKYIRNVISKEEELYDLEVDPLEKNNIAHEHQALLDKFRTYLGRTREHKMSFFNKVLGEYPPRNTYALPEFKLY